jgi:N-acyl-D-amino-acid deacylase
MKTLIKNCNLVDGTGSPGRNADILIEGDRIVAVGNLTSGDAVIIDATGLVVSPGFIDAHTHYDFILGNKEDISCLIPLLYQGITTVICGCCGISPAPAIPPGYREQKRFFGETFSQRKWPPEEECRTLDSFLNMVEENNPIVNAAFYVGFSTVRSSVMGFKSGKASDEEREQMRALIRQSMEEGALGVSFGLEYVSSAFADTEEMIYVCSDLKDYGGRISAHIRSLGIGMAEATREVITIAETLGVLLQISHYAPFCDEALPEFFEGVGEIDMAMERGVGIGIDLVALLFSMTTPNEFFPYWLFDGGVDKAAERLKDEMIRKEVVEYLTTAISSGFETWNTLLPVYNQIVVIGGTANRFAHQLRLFNFKQPENLSFEGKTLAEIATERGQGDEPYEVFLDLTLEEDFNLYMCVSLSYEGVEENTFDDNDALLKTALPVFQLPFLSCGSDVIGGDRNSNPGLYAHFPRFIGTIGRDWEGFPLEEAVHKCTGLPAKQFGIKERGLIKEGYYADLVIFDKDTIKERANTANCTEKPEGIHMVFLNGQKVVEDNEYLGEKRYGKVLRKFE